MPILTDEMKQVVAEQKLGYVGTVCADGTPNVSPKATFVVLDDDHLAFGEIRSPNTVENLAANPAVEINFVNPLSRRGFRFKGSALYLTRGTADFDALLPQFAEWGDLSERINGIVKVRVDRARPLISPAYDLGATEDELRATWKAYYNEL